MRNSQKKWLNRQLNHFIYITPSKQLGSGPWLTLNFCEIHYLTTVIYDHATTNFHRGQFSPRARGGGLKDNFITDLFYQGHYLP
jgi:hypothetical protein